MAAPDFTGRVALVTGGSGSIGGGVAEALRAHGARVVAADLHGKGAAAGAEGVRPLDVTDKAAVGALVEAVEREFGGVDILVNAAGVVSFGDAHGLAEAEWDRVIDINLKGSFLACQAVMGTMKRRGYGRIVNVGSVVGKNGGNARPWLDPAEQRIAGNVAYGVSKAGVHAMTAFLAKELAASGVTVNAVAPGPIATAMTTAFPATLRALIPAGRMGTVDDVARAVLFLAAEEAGFISGEILDINGGMWCD
ncbi:3-oxoacyl-ACP reductase FabG [Pigmentiphaga soli]|uniref:3-oxoacyl-ACP reductase FabG n=1 Tax=Pigmentiphaga soli TaxID=1007095 RepID=A0ABP8HMT2_9BURK